MLSVEVSHPDYADEIHLTYRDAELRKALRQGTWTKVMAEGMSIPGVVLDDQGQPIHGARVGLSGLDPEFYPVVTTTEQGLFRTERVAAGKPYQLVAAAPGRAPALIEIQAEPDMVPVEFRLEPGHTIHGQVIDENGAPLRRAVRAHSRHAAGPSDAVLDYPVRDAVMGLLGGKESLTKSAFRIPLEPRAKTLGLHSLITQADAGPTSASSAVFEDSSGVSIR